MTDRDDDTPAKPTFINANRRGFLQGAAVASTVAATGVAVAENATEQLAVEPVQTTQGKGYELTDHVKKYYQRARF